MSNIRVYEASVSFEVSIDYEGSNYLLIYGKHVNGYYCSIVNQGLSCEMSEPNDLLYNTEKLMSVGLSVDVARYLAMQISTIASSDKVANMHNKTSEQLKELVNLVLIKDYEKAEKLAVQYHFKLNS